MFWAEARAKKANNGARTFILLQVLRKRGNLPVGRWPRDLEAYLCGLHFKKTKDIYDLEISMPYTNRMRATRVSTHDHLILSNFLFI